jgi:hypothetical protein
MRWLIRFSFVSAVLVSFLGGWATAGAGPLNVNDGFVSEEFSLSGSESSVHGILTEATGTNLDLTDAKVVLKDGSATIYRLPNDSPAAQRILKQQAGRARAEEADVNPIVVYNTYTTNPKGVLKFDLPINKPMKFQTIFCATKKTEVSAAWQVIMMGVTKPVLLKGLKYNLTKSGVYVAELKVTHRKSSWYQVTGVVVGKGFEPDSWSVTRGNYFIYK